MPLGGIPAAADETCPTHDPFSSTAWKNKVKYINLQLYINNNGAQVSCVFCVVTRFTGFSFSSPC